VVRTKNYLGRSNWGSDAYANMLLSDVRIWSVARTQAEIQANKDRALTGTEPYLRAWWRLDEPRRTDFGPNAKDAAPLGTVTEYRSLVPPEFLNLYPRTMVPENPVLALDGVDDYVEIPHLAAFNVQQFTLEAWIKPRALNDWAGIITKGKNSSSFAMQIHTKRLLLAINVGGPAGGIPAGQTWRSNTELQEDVWQHVAITYDGATIRFYINGVLDSNQPAATPILGAHEESLFLGADFPGGDEYFKGNLSEVRIWSRALSGLEIIVNLNNRLTGEEADLVGYWPLNEGVRGTAYSLKVYPPANPLYYDTVNKKPYLLMDGYLRHIPDTVYKGLISNTFANYWLGTGRETG